MKRPVADRIGGEVPRNLAAWLYDNRVLARRVVAVAGHQLEEMSMDVDRVSHHAVIDKIYPDTFTLKEGNSLHFVRHLDAVKGPHETLHVASQMNIERAVGGANIWITIQCHQVLVHQHTVTNILQTLARLPGPVHRHR